MYVTFYKSCNYSITLSRDFFPLKSVKSHIKQERVDFDIGCYTDGEVKLYAQWHENDALSTSFIYKLA